MPVRAVLPPSGASAAIHLSSRNRMASSLIKHGGIATTKPRAGVVEVQASLKFMRDRIASVKSTKKITEAMKLVAAAKVRRAQTAVISGRPFSQELLKMMFAVNVKMNSEISEVPLCNIRPVKTVAIICCTGDRGLCGGFNSFVIKKTEARVRELNATGIKAKLICVGKKGATYFKKRSNVYDVMASFDMGQSPTSTRAEEVSDEIQSSFLGDEVDKVELIYSKFVSLVSSKPTVHTLLPVTKIGSTVDASGKSVDPIDDEVFLLTSQVGKFAIDSDVPKETSSADVPVESLMAFEQDPVQVMDALLPLYLSSQILRAFQESLASELAARMNAMNSATDNAKELGKSLSTEYNRVRQSKITNEIIELVAAGVA